MSDKLTATVKLTRAQHYFLCTRYGRRKDVSATVLIKQAILEIVALQAQRELDESGYDVKKEEASEQ